MDIVERLRDAAALPTGLYAEAADEIERLRQCLQYEQHRAERIGTHGQGCWAWGPQHYECALREIESLRKERDELVAKVKWMEGNTPNWGWPWDAPFNDGYETAKDEFRKEIVKVEDQLTRYRAVMEQAKAKMISYEATGYWNTDLVEKAITALREVLKEE